VLLCHYTHHVVHTTSYYTSNIQVEKSFIIQIIVAEMGEGIIQLSSFDDETWQSPLSYVLPSPT
jgi:hypothetical protein